jgi:hypothetical protein
MASTGKMFNFDVLEPIKPIRDKIVNAFDGKTLFIIALFLAIIYYMFGYFSGRLDNCEKTKTENEIAFQIKVAELIIEKDRKLDSANANTIREVKFCQTSVINLMKEINAMQEKMKKQK